MANVGTVQSVTGLVRAIAEDGSERLLSIGDTVAENEKIITGDGIIVIAFNDGTVMDLGSNSNIVLNDDVLNQENGEQTAQNRAEANDEVAALQEALANPNFDPTAELPATAAGATAAGGTDGNNGHTIVSVDYLNPDAPVESGFNTVGINQEFLQADEELPPVESESESEVFIHVELSKVIDSESQGVFEDQEVTYIATLDQTSTGNINVVLSNGSVIVINANELTGTVTLPAQGDDVYIDPELVTTTITGVSGGAGETLIFDSTPVEVQVNDTIDDTSVDLSASAVFEGDSAVYTFTATLDNASQGETTVVTDQGDITIVDGATTGTLVIDSSNGEDVYLDSTSLTTNITSASGGNFENIVIGDAQATAEINDTIDVVTVDLTATAAVLEDVDSEGGTENVITYTATLTGGVAANDITVTLDNSEIITITAGQTSGSITTAVVDEDVYIDGTPVVNSIASAVETNAGTAGALESLVLAADTSVSTTVNDTIDVVTVDLTATAAVLEDVDSEGGTENVITYTATLTGGVAANDITVTLDNSEIITITAGQTSGSITTAVVDEDVYIDGTPVVNSIASAVETNAGTAGALESLVLAADTSVSTTVNDTIDATTVTLTGDASVVEGGTITYTATVSNAPQGDLTFTVNLIHFNTVSGDITTIPTDVTIPDGELFTTFDVVIAEDAETEEGPEDYIITLSDPVGGNYESLDLSGATITTTILDIQPSTAYLVVNTSNSGGGGATGDQSFDITITSPDGSTNTTVPTQQPEEGQQAIALEFTDDVVFAAGRTYTIVMEHTSGSAHTKVTDLTLVDKFGNEILLNGVTGNDDVTLTEGDDASYDGVIYTVHIDSGGISVGYTVEPVVGYDVTADQTLYIENPLSGQNDVALDFGELDINGTNDLFGHIQTIDISGSGLREDNSISLSAQDVIELGDGVSDVTINIVGDTADTVNLIDQDAAGGAAWLSDGANGDGTETFTYYDTGVNTGTAIASVIIESDVSVVGVV